MKSPLTVKRAPSFPTKSELLVQPDDAYPRGDSTSVSPLEESEHPAPAARTLNFRWSYLFEIAAILVVWAFCERELLKSLPQGMEGDSIGYQIYARDMTWLFDTNIREPIWIWCTWLFSHVWGDSPGSLRLGSMYTFLATDCLVYLLTVVVTKSRLAGIMSFLIFGLNPFLLYLGLSGNRDNMVLLSMTGLTLCTVFREFPKNLRLRIFAITLFSVLAVGCRLSNYPGVGLLLAYAVVRHFVKARHLIFPAVAVALVVVPYLFYCSEQYHDAFAASNVHAAWFRNYEFCYVKKTGCDGCSCDTYFNAKGEVVEPYGGAKITAGHYVFGMHSQTELVHLLALGITTILFSEGTYFEQLSGFHFNFIFPVYLLGLAALLASKRRVVLLVPLVSINLVFFTVNMMPARIFSILSPFFALAIAFGAAVCVSAVMYLVASAIPKLRPLVPINRSVWN